MEAVEEEAVEEAVEEEEVAEVAEVVQAEAAGRPVSLHLYLDAVDTTLTTSHFLGSALVLCSPPLASRRSRSIWWWVSFSSHSVHLAKS